MNTSTATTAEVLTSTVAALSTADSVERLTGIVAAAVRTLLDADGATFVLREDDKCFYVDEDAISPLWKGSRFPMSACISGWAMQHREVVVVPDIYLDDRIPHDAYRPTFVKSLCMAPVRAADPIGALGAYWSDSRTPTPAEVRMLEVLANSAAIGLENLELRGQVARRSAERDQFESRKDELESAIHTIAHDLRSPLGAMTGYAELLADGAATSPEQARQFARTIVESGHRMAQQIDRMLALYRVTHEQLAPARVDLSEIGREVAGRLGAQVSGRTIEVEVDDDLHAIADPVLAHLLVENLMSNAFKYTGKRKDAFIEMRRLDKGAPLSTFYVRDNGAGFEASEAHRLFSPMTRLHADSEFPGTGLGLASVARIVELHGGQIRAEGEISQGAAFFFSLPVAG